MSQHPELFLGGVVEEGGPDEVSAPWHLRADRLRTHAVVVGMTGSGKTGLSLVLLEELVRAGVPIVAIDPKGDIGSLGLLFPELSEAGFGPWVEGGAGAEVAARWKKGLGGWGLGASDVAGLRDRLDLRLHTPGSSAGIGVNVLGSFRRPSEAELQDAEGRRAVVSATVSGLLGLAGRTADPVRDPAHVVLSKILDDAWERGEDPDLEAIVLALVDPPFQRVGVFPVDRFFPPDDRMDLAMSLNAVLASPGFAAWRQGVALDVDRMFARPEDNGGRTPVSVFCLSHLDETQRAFFLSLLLGRIQAWSRRQPGTERLRAALYFDEVAGWMPPHPHNPPTKAPLLSLMKQARAVGLGVVLATQNPVDLDYKALSNAGAWMIGRLQTAQDRERLLKGIGRRDLDSTVQGLAKRCFLVHITGKDTAVIGSRHAMCYLRGPLTPVEIARLNENAHSDSVVGQVAPAAPPPVPPRVGVAGPPPVPPRRGPPPVPPRRSASPPPVPPVSPSSAPPPVPPIPTASAVDDGLLPAPPMGALGFVDPRVVFSAKLDGAFVDHAEPARADGIQVWRPALMAELHLRFDEDRYGFVLDEHQHRLWFPLGSRLGGEPTLVAFAAGDILDRAPAGGRYAPVPAWCDEKTEMRALQKKVADDVYRTESRSAFVHKGLKLHSAVGESRDAFEARAREAAVEAADAKIAKLQDRFEKAARRIETKVAKVEDRIVAQEGIVQARKTEEMVGIGETVLSFFVGRTRSVGTAVRRRGTTNRAAQKLDGLENDLERAQDEANALAEKLAEEVEALRQEAEDDAVGGIEDKDVRLERTDIRVARFGIVWIPVGRRV